VTVSDIQPPAAPDRYTVECDQLDFLEESATFEGAALLGDEHRRIAGHFHQCDVWPTK